jgi:hypothetical protein
VRFLFSKEITTHVKTKILTRDNGDNMELFLEKGIRLLRFAPPFIYGEIFTTGD